MHFATMSSNGQDSSRERTDESLRAERRNTDRELARRVTVTDEDADEVLRIARERADRLLQAARDAADARLPLNEQTAAAVALLLEQRDKEDLIVAFERRQADELIGRERIARGERLSAQLELERQTTDLHLAVERRASDNAVESRDEFLAQASHDLRGLMGAQKIYLSLLAKHAKADHGLGALAEHVAALVKIEAQMDRLVGDLVDIVAIEAGKLAVVPSAYPAIELLSTAASVFDQLAREREQSLSMVPVPADVKVSVDLTRGIQVLSNLLSNAIKFTPAGGMIRVGFDALDDEVVFFVADDGPGVPAEQAEHLFERFIVSTSAPAGLGLGLFIASRVVEAHGGRLWFDREQTAGSTFRFALRRA
jgi:signal transduction histidine kinase